MNIVFKRNSIRAKKAKLTRALIKSHRQMLIGSVSVLAGIGGGLMVYGGIDQGYWLGMITVCGVMTLAWLHGDLKESPGTLAGSEQGTVLVHKALDRRVLARMSKNDMSPYDLWTDVRGLWRQRFFSVRFLLHPDIFEQGLSKDPADSDQVWDTALKLTHNEGRDEITAATLLVALFLNMPNYDVVLKQIGLDVEDLIAGIGWQRHIELVAERFKEKHHFGGLARDWASGYTPMLSQYSKNISHEIQMGGLLARDTDVHLQTVEQMLGFLSQSARQNVVLVGDVGSGKSTTVRSFAQRLLLDPNIPKNMQYQQVVELNAATILAQAGDRGKLEKMVLGVMSEAFHAKNIILFFDHAELFFKEATGSVDLANVLLPIIQAGRVRMIFSMNARDWQELISRNRALTGMMNYIAVPVPEEADIKRILEDQVLMIEHRHKVIFTYQALEEAYNLADRYITDQVFPGKAISVMEQAVTHAQNKLVTAESVQSAIETTRGVKVSKASTSEKEQLLNLEVELHKRMINQTRAVTSVSNALRRSRSGVGNPQRPTGTFLFLGPTGVGKTELSKALAGAYYGGEENIVRVDMNEYVRPKDVKRFLAPKTDTGTSFLGHIRQQPFSVVLLDEIEKAHPDIVNVLLQLLDEGRISDTDNRVVNFRDAIIIATSNAGADEIRQRIQAGQDLESFEKEFIDQLIGSGIFKPEFLNRFDEIILFRPLNQDELLQVVDLLLARVNKTLDKQKIVVALTPRAKQWIVQKGYDPRLGARPMQRMMQQTVENIVAKRLLEGQLDKGMSVTLDVPDMEVSGV